MKRAFLAAALLACATLAAPLRAAETLQSTTGATPAMQTASVTIDNFSFTPAQITVAAGTRVTWTNHDDIPHTVTDAADPRAFRSPPLDSDDAVSVTFDKPGTYRYFCSLHPHMQGTVIVE